MEPNDQIEQQRVTMVIEDLTAEACWFRLAQVPTEPPGADVVS